MQNSKKLYFFKQFPCSLCVDQELQGWARIVRQTSCHPAAPKQPPSRLLFLKDQPHCKCKIPKNCTFLNNSPAAYVWTRYYKFGRELCVKHCAIQPYQNNRSAGFYS